MTAENLLNAFSYIDDAIIEKSEQVLKQKRLSLGDKITLTATAAVVALVVAGGGFALWYSTGMIKRIESNADYSVRYLQADGIHYQEVYKSSEGDFCRKHGLPLYADAEDIKGEQVSGSLYTVRGSEYKNILIEERNGKLYYWSLAQRGYNSFETLEENLRFYGYSSADDILTMRADGRKVKDRGQIGELWDALTNGTVITFEEYEAMFISEDYDEATYHAVYYAHADSAVKIEFNYGEYNYLDLTYYPDIDCLNVGFFYIKLTSPLDF